jgi:ankyrin repeat protein
MIENETLSNERDDLKKERDGLLQLRVDIQQAVEQKEEMAHELELATVAKEWAIANMKNAEEDAEVQRRAKKIADAEVQELKDVVSRSIKEMNDAKKELHETSKILTQVKFDNRKANGEILRFKNTLKDKIQEMKDKLNQAALNLQRSRALGEDRESELNRWIERLTYQIFQQRKQIKRESELKQSKWRHDQDHRLVSLIQSQQQKMEQHQHNLLLSMSDPLLGTTAGLKSKKAIKTSNFQLKKLTADMQHSQKELTRLRNVTGLIEELVSAAADGQTSKVKHFIRNHPTIINSLNIENQSAIQVASKQGNFDCCKVLLDGGCDAEPIHEMGTPLYLASKEGHHTVVNLLMTAKYRIPLFACGTKHDRRTALHAACCNGHLKCVKLLSNDSKQNYNIKDIDQRTPLHLVCTKKNNSRLLTSHRCEIIRLLIQRGSTIHARDRAGNTPILLAAMAGCISMVETCIEFGGASILCRNRSGKSPIDEARIRKDTRMMERLNELQKEIPRSVVLASRFAGYNVTGQNISGNKKSTDDNILHSNRNSGVTGHEETMHQKGDYTQRRIHQQHISFAVSNRKDGMFPEVAVAGGSDSSSGSSSIYRKNRNEILRNEDASPDASELLDIQSRPSSRF